MLNFCSLYSGSSGNSLFIQSENTKILVDCGVSCKKIEEALKTLEVDASSINAILVTHEHIDHVKGLSIFASKYNLPIFASTNTFDYMQKFIDRIDEKNLKTFHIDDKFTIGDLEIAPFSIPHDAANPCGFNILNNNKKISVATDIGHMTNTILKKLEGSSFVLLESNYDTNVLKCCSYPFMLKSRISGPTGHLSNEIASKTLSYLFKNGLNSAMLGHLSKESNFPELAYQTALDELISNGIDSNSISLGVAHRDFPGKLINI
ncbi:MAG: MBL fold metallo-hydrolase [Clostridia bacterium]|nr:MBL fold metallo-hydrolase [Clostridia bacterium]